MKRSLLLLLGVSLVAAGCYSRRYDITLRSGNIITAKGKPRLDANGRYVFTDVQGRTNAVNASQVSQIAPHQDRKDPKTDFFLSR